MLYLLVPELPAAIYVPNTFRNDPTASETNKAIAPDHRERNRLVGRIDVCSGVETPSYGGRMVPVTHGDHGAEVIKMILGQGQLEYRP